MPHADDVKREMHVYTSLLLAKLYYLNQPGAVYMPGIGYTSTTIWFIIHSGNALVSEEIWPVISHKL